MFLCVYLYAYACLNVCVYVCMQAAVLTVYPRAVQEVFKNSQLLFNFLTALLPFVLLKHSHPTLQSEISFLDFSQLKTALLAVGRYYGEPGLEHELVCPHVIHVVQNRKQLLPSLCPPPEVDGTRYY